MGAGGAGFPTYVKLAEPVDTLIINGAECEPLLYKDNTLMQRHTAELMAGIKLIQQLLSPERTVIGIKSKNSRSIEQVRRFAPETDLEIHLLEDYYPSGDEVNLLFEITGKTIPPAGIPLAINIVVLNVETVINIQRASRDQPVTHTMITVNGAVRQPVTSWFPIGISFAEAIAFAGGSNLRDYVAIDGGPMMGRIVEDMDTPVVKASSGILVIPRDHGYARLMTSSPESRTRIGRSACDQCNMCTQMCPRYLLGYPVEPHRVMRHQQTITTPPVSRWGELCCECGICTLVSCPENLDPRLACQLSKQSLRQIGEKYNGPKIAVPHPLGDYRKLASKQVIRRLGLSAYQTETPFREFEAFSGNLRLKLSQHAGTAATPVVKAGDRIKTDQLLAEVQPDQPGVGVHSPINGTVIGVNEEEIVIQ